MYLHKNYIKRHLYPTKAPEGIRLGSNKCSASIIERPKRAIVSGKPAQIVSNS
jgi:hypothetical protein